jgi:hypothetical protein
MLKTDGSDLSSNFHGVTFQKTLSKIEGSNKMKMKMVMVMIVMIMTMMITISYSSVPNLPSSLLLSKNIKIKIYRIINWLLFCVGMKLGLTH